MAHYEIEIKSLLGEAEVAKQLKDKMLELDPACTQTAGSKQLNHYFSDGDIQLLFGKTIALFDEAQVEKFRIMIEKGTDFSVRTRQKDSLVQLVVKASVDGGTSSNGVSRLEFEEAVPLTLAELDDLIIGAGYVYQAKWSRDREEYDYKGVTVCIDRNAGYGYLAEFEKITEDENAVATVRNELESLMAELGVVELTQDRLARMFDFYNHNWADYYGTEKTFTIE